MSLLVGIYNTSRLHIDNYNRATHSKLVTCAACNRTLIGKKGIKVVHHYAHEQDAKCAAIKRDSDGKTSWHLLWQNIAKPENIEIITKKDGKTHIADIVNESGTVIEIQHSNLLPTDIQNREIFYDNMIWLLDGAATIVRDTLKNKCKCLFGTANDYYVVQKLLQHFGEKCLKIDTLILAMEYLKL